MSYKLEKHIQTATNGNIVNLVLHFVVDKVFPHVSMLQANKAHGLSHSARSLTSSKIFQTYLTETRFTNTTAAEIIKSNHGKQVVVQQVQLE